MVVSCTGMLGGCCICLGNGGWSCPRSAQSLGGAGGFALFNPCVSAEPLGPHPAPQGAWWVVVSPSAAELQLDEPLGAGGEPGLGLSDPYVKA